MSITEAAKRVVVGRKLASEQLGDTLLPKSIALPVFASDALSSVAYAPDEILLTLSLAGMAGFGFSWKIGALVATVMLIVVASYTQTVHAYPNGGGGYEVARHNLGPIPGLVVASALFVDYTLTVAVSVASGVDNAESVIPWLVGKEVWVTLGVIALITLLNLRGVRESGTLFAIPTYCFMAAVLGMTLWGLVRMVALHQHLVSQTTNLDVVSTSSYASSFAGFTMVVLLARAFASGCSALTGVEAISNSVPAFRKPKEHNAAMTLAMLGGLAVSMLMGILFLVTVTHTKMVNGPEGASLVDHLTHKPVNLSPDTVIGQVSAAVFGHGSVPFYFVMISTMVILFIAANTAFNGFPTLGSILARDGYLPRQLHQRGDRLAYSNGIIMLAAVACGIVIIFDANVTSMIQLYVIGVFVSFTLSQTGMIKHWTRHLASERDPQRRRSMHRSRIINAVGLVATVIVLAVILIAKFVHGAYLAVLAMLFMFVLMNLIHRHYVHVSSEVAWSDTEDNVLPSRVHAVVLVLGMNKPTIRALNFAKAARPNTLEALTVSVDEADTQELVEEWEKADFGVPLQIIASPYREVTGPVVNYVKAMRTENPRDVVAMYIPEYVVGHWWEQALHNQTALAIKTRLHFTPGVMITSVPYILHSGRALAVGSGEISSDDLDRLSGRAGGGSATQPPAAYDPRYATTHMVKE